MDEKEFKIKDYYIIRKKALWAVIIAIAIVVTSIGYKIYTYTNAESEYQESYKIEYGSLKSELENIDECYLCGNSDHSMMGYYRKFDTIGVIGLNEWYVLDLRLKEYDEQGVKTEDSGSMSTVLGNSQGVNYHVEATPSRRMSSATISSEKDFDATVIKNHLCQGCLDKVTDTLKSYCYEGEEEVYYPFVLVDFETLEVYSLQHWHTGVSIRDYWVEMGYADDSGELKIDAYYLPIR